MSSDPGVINVERDFLSGLFRPRILLSVSCIGISYCYVYCFQFSVF